MKALKTQRLDKSPRDLGREQQAELERSNDSLRESERRLRELIDRLPVAVYTTDADGYLTRYNEAAVAFWGRRPVLGKDRWCGSWKLYSADGAPMPSDRCPLAIALREQRPVRDIEVTAERPDGIRLTFIPHPTPLRDTSGGLIGAMNVLVDITERKRAETELNAVRQQLMCELASMTRLHEVSMRFVQQGELHGLLDQILDAAIGITGAGKGNIQLLNSDERTLRIATQRGFSSDFLEFFTHVNKGEAACGTVLERMERVIVEDVTTSPIFAGTAALKVMLSAGSRAVQSTPVLARDGRLLGIFSTHYGVPRRFTESDLRLLDLLARQAADFIERFQSDEKLRESRQQIEGILESAMDAIISVDADQRIILFNRAAEQVFQCPASEAIGSPLERFIPGQFGTQQAGHNRRFRETSGTNRNMGKLATIRGLRADGEEFPIEASISQVQSAGKEFYTVIVRDITRRVREEGTLRRQAELLHLSHDAIFVWNAESGIQFWSDGATQLYGYEESEVYGMLPHELFKTGFLTPWPQIEAELHEQGLWEGELHRKNKADREVIVSCRLQLVSDNGKTTLILETDRDITERRRLEQELLEISSAEQRRIGQDLHDGLCQHLAGIEFRTSVLIDELANSPKAQQEAAKIGELIRDGARQARMLSRGLSPVSLETHGLMSGLKELTENTSELFNNTCRFECGKPISIEDNIVATHLYRIAQEAISNAARHGRAGTIVVALRRTVSETRLSITDDGCGLPAPAARSGGMGLRIMRYRAELIGAVLTIGPAKGAGTSVTCVLRNSL